MKKVIVTVDDVGNLVDDNGVSLGLMAANFVFKEFDDTKIKVDVAKLMGFGASADDLIKLKATGVI